jgi:hypothetical protein
MATPAVSTARPSGDAASIYTRPAPRWIALVTVVAALLAVWAWQHWIGTSTISARPVAVVGTVGVVGGPATQTSSPAIPVNHPRPQPFQRVLVTGTTTADTTIRRLLRTDRQGHFSLSLPTGAYNATSIFIRNAPMSDQPSQGFTVRSGHPIHLRLIDPAP